MPGFARTITIPASGVVDNAFDGFLFKYAPRGGRLSAFAVSDTAGTTFDLTIGNVVTNKDDLINVQTAANLGPDADKDAIVAGEGIAPGDLLTLTIKGTAAAVVRLRTSVVFA